MHIEFPKILNKTPFINIIRTHGAPLVELTVGWGSHQVIVALDAWIDDDGWRARIDLLAENTSSAKKEGG